MSEIIGSELQPTPIPVPEIAAHRMDAVRNLGGFATGAYVEARLTENGQNYNEFTTNTAAMLGVDEQRLASDVFNAVGSGEDDLRSLYDRWHQERPSDGVQGPVVGPSMIKQGVAKQLGFEDVRSMAAAAHEQHRMHEEMLRVQDEEDDDRKEPGKVIQIGTRQHHRKQGASSHDRQDRKAA